MHVFKGILFVEMQSEWRALGPKKSQKTTCKNQDGILIKIFNDKSWPQQEDVFCNLKEEGHNFPQISRRVRGARKFQSNVLCKL